MSAVSAAPPNASREAVAWLGRPWPVGLAAALLAAVAAATIVAGDVLLRPGWFALFTAYNVLAFAGAGLLWLRRRPASRVGPMLLVVAGLAGVVGLQGSSAPLAFSVGVLFDPVLAIAAWYLLLTYPSDRLTRPAAATLGLGIVAVGAGFVPWFFFSTTIAGATPLARCTAGCPANVLVLADRPGLAGHFDTFEQVLRMLFAAAFIALLAVRVAFASRPRRRVLAPVHTVAGVWLALFGAYGVVAFLLVTDRRLWDTLGWMLTGARLALPLAFVLALALAQLYAGGALSRTMRRLGARPGPAELERVLRAALGDPRLRLALWREPEAGWSDPRGEPAGPDAGRGWREVVSDGLPVAALSYDAALDEDPELLDAAGVAVLLSLDGSRLDAARREVLSELRESRRRIATANEAERRRIERDLHDGAQQRLVALRLNLDLASRRLGDDSDLAVLGVQVDAALEEIRAIARGVYPATLRDLGVGAALAQAVRSDPRARLETRGLDRYPSEIEAAVYYSALEALQNAAKHAGPEARITVGVWHDAGELRFEVRDDGPGFDPGRARPDGGLTGMRDRLAAAGGVVEVASSPGAGTSVRGAVPAPPA